MPYKNPAEKRAYDRDRHDRLRSEWLAANGPCVECGSPDELQIDHVDPEQKASHRIWTWSVERRAAELAKCQVLCGDCHRAKTRSEKLAPCGTRSAYKRGCRCEACRAANTAYARASRAPTKHARSLTGHPMPRSYNCEGRSNA